MSRRLAAAITAAAAAAGALTAACTDVGADPDTPVAIGFDTLPAAAVVYGDTLRDIDGVARPLTVHVYNIDGDEIAGAPVQFFVSDTAALAIDSATRFAIATIDTTKRSVVVRAQAGGLPSAQGRTIELVPSPDSAARAAGVPGTRVDTVTFAAGDTIATSAPLVIRVLDRQSPPATDTLRGVRSWRVRYRVTHPAGADTLLVDDANRRSTIDTTGADGSAGRRLRFRRAPGGTFPDSVVAEARARYRAGDIPGSPIVFIVLVRPR